MRCTRLPAGHIPAIASMAAVAALAPLLALWCAPAAGEPPARTPPAHDAKAHDALPHRALAPPAAPRDFDQLQQQFAQRLVDAHPDATYRGAAPDRLYAIPVLEVELDRDGSVRRIVVLRRPSTGDEATRLAIAAVRNAAPYGDLSQVPRPWKVVEFFLFDDDLKFKPRTLDR